MIQLAVVFTSVVALLLTRRYRRNRLPGRTVIISAPNSTSIARDGAVRSVQSAELTVPRDYLDRRWNARNLENLARTYWRFLSRVTLGLIRVEYGENERSVVFLIKPLTLLRFEAPEYDLQSDRGCVRWRIRDGLLVARNGRGSGLLAIEVFRLGEDIPRPGQSKLRIDIEVANFYPAIAAGFGGIVYEFTQSTIHLLVTHAFLRSLATLDLAESKVRSMAGPELNGDPAAAETTAPGAPGRQP